MQNGGLTREAAPAQQTQPGGDILGTINNTVRGSAADLARIFTGKAQSFAGADGSQDFGPAAGRSVVHAAPALRNNPRFQQLLKTDPAAARRLIMAIQRRGLDAPMAPANDLDSSAYYPQY